MKEIPKAYNSSEVEDAIYKKWEDSGYFNPDKLPGKRPEYFSVSMPPPNVTGVLHLGHALENSIMDTAVRYQRLRGKKAVIIPGTDHAAVATQARVEKNLMKEGMKDPRQELGREKLLEVVRDYAEKSKATILSQIKKIGTSCDWSRLAYTFDEQRSKAVNKVFIKMYNDGLIYRGYRVVNWTVKGQSTCSDDELIYVEREAKFYTFKYDKDFPFAISTTRPETKLGDTAVAVNPKDERYQKYIGQTLTANVGAKEPLQLKIIADNEVDPNFGTGALGVTPAHSMIDYEMAQKNNLPIIPVIGPDGKMTEEAGKDYADLTVLEAREKFVQRLKDNGLLEKEEDIKQNVGTSDRFGDVIEVIPMTQWWINVNKEIPGRAKTLKDLMRAAVTTGHNNDKNQIIKITPENYTKVYLQWIDNLRDWCISRQIWWGHRIPVWYCADCGEIIVSENKPEKCPKCGLNNLTQDEDSLDTWFSSGLWTFSTLGWPDNLDSKGKKIGDLKMFHPTTWMQMGYEILFPWMARMILMTTYMLDEIPFKDVYIHGILRDKNGQKFSKSLGNGINPIEVCNQYGTDALRLSLISGMSAGNDSRFYEEKVEGNRNFVNKLWNISRYILTSTADLKLIAKQPKAKTLANEWILNRFNNLVIKTSKELDQYNFSTTCDLLREFTWSDFADWYLEISKLQMANSKWQKNTEEILLYILQNLLILWHPILPFVTEAIWENFEAEDLLIVQLWPESVKKIKEVKDFNLIVETISLIRNLRAENKIEPGKKVNVRLIGGKNVKLLKDQANIISGLARIENLEITDKGEKPAQSIGGVVSGVEIYILLEGLLDVAKETERLKKEIESIKNYISGLEKKLSNQEFVKNAPQEIVDKEKAKMEEQREKLKKLEMQLKGL